MNIEEIRKNHQNDNQPEHWASTRDTDVRIMRAIFELAADFGEVDMILEYPTNDQLAKLREMIDGDHSDMVWTTDDRETTLADFDK